MALMSSHGRGIVCHLQTGVEKKLDFHQQNTVRTTVLGSDGISSCAGAALFAATEEFGRLGGCGRAGLQRQERCSGIQHQRRVHSRARSVAVRSAALDGKDVVCAGNEGLFDKFLEHAVQAVSQRIDLSPLPCQDEFRDMVAIDGQSVIKNVAFESSKMRLFRCATINGGENMQVLNVAICARPEYDLPIFCADFFSTPRMSIVVLDLNPLYNTEERPDYKAKYFSSLFPLGNKYAELLPWGDKLTAESIQFFSPIVVWTRPGSREVIEGTVFSAFKEYLAVNGEWGEPTTATLFDKFIHFEYVKDLAIGCVQAWLDMAEKAEPSGDAVEIADNRESHHRYLTWRATKDPGRFILLRLYGEELCEKYITEFLFNGINTLGEKKFLDYFPEYRGADGGIVKQRSVAGKAFGERPWNKDGIFAPSLI